MGVALAAGAAAALGLGACTSRFETHRESLAAMERDGRYDLIAAELDEPEILEAYGQKNRLLWWLERGGAALALGNDDKAIAELNKADDYMEIQREQTGGEKLATWLTNDTASPYYAPAYEDLYINVLKLLAHLEAGRVEPDPERGGATVEARRLASKADHLRDLYLRATREAERDDRYVEARGTLQGGPKETVEEGRFVESPLGTYLTAITFMKSGDSGLQSVAGRRLIDSIEVQKSQRWRVNPGDFAGVGEWDAGDANVLIVALSGQGPVKEPERIGPVPIYTYTVYFELPRLVPGSARAGGARVVFATPESDAAVATVPLNLVEDIGVVAAENFERERPAIYARAVLRSTAKAAGWVVGTEAARRGTSGDESAQAAVEILGILGGLLFVTQTEKADLRTWLMLPGQAHVGVAKLEPGAWRARVEYTSAADGSGEVLYAGEWREIEIGADAKALTTIVERWWE